MSFRMSTLERAFQLAKSGSAANISAIRIMLRKEGYESRQIEGGSLLVKSLPRATPFRVQSRV
jgi:hypothetical protein